MKRAGTTVWFLLLACASGCQLHPPEDQIRLSKPVKARGVEHPERLFDDERSLEGARWNVETASRFVHPTAYVEFDLGESTPIRATYVQGDNNDEFIVETSDDGTEFTTLWRAGPVSGSGLRSRWALHSEGSGRYVRLRAKGGDRWVSVSEFQIFSSKPRNWPPRIARRIETTAPVLGAGAILLFALFASLAVILHGRGSRMALQGLLWAVTAIAAGAAAYAVSLSWPPREEVVNASRAAAALVACAAVFRLRLRRPVEGKRALTALLAAMAVLSVATFYNLGHPQFWDGSARRPTYVHGWDLRVYFPTAKYFEELGYDGVYLASVKAYSEEELNGTLHDVEHFEIRDLQNYEMKQIREVATEIDAVKGRFSVARWAEFKSDMAYFWKSMARRGYFDSLRDHGANATPAWLFVAHLLFRSVRASEAVFLWRALLDPLLLAIFFIAAWRSFGLRPALVCLVAFGATTFYQLGSNWGGATLRHDWMVLLGLGTCALKSRRLFLAGALLGWSAMIRAFPALALVFVVVWLGWKWLDGPRDRRERQPNSSSSRSLPLLRLGAGVAVIVVGLGCASAATFGLQRSWGAWAEKISIHVNDPNFNHVGLTALVGYKTDNLGYKLRKRGEDPRLWKSLTAQTVHERWWLRGAGMLFFTLLAVLAVRRSTLSDAAVVGSMMIPIFFYPSNYYLHSIFIWPLLLAARDGPEDEHYWAAVAVLGFCFLQWFGWFIPGKYGQFLLWSGLLLALIFTLLVLTIKAGQPDHKTKW